MKPGMLHVHVDDLHAVLDAAGCERPALFGFSEGGPIGVLFAATYPQRVRALVLYGSFANGSLENDESPGRAKWLKYMTQLGESIDHWGEGRSIDWGTPSRSHSGMNRRASGALERAGMSPRMAMLTWEACYKQVDVREILGSVRVPTLVLHREGDAIPVEFGRELAEGILGARLVELDGADHWPGAGDIASITGEVEEFLTGHRHEAAPDRVLATVMFTDIVDSTRRAAELGDRCWREMLERHDELTRAEVSRLHGRVVKHTGDGFLATFDGPTRAVRCATRLTQRMPELGIEVRSGLHTGECELRGEDIGGIAVHIGARIGALATAGEVLVSSTVKDLVNGSGIVFNDRGTHVLKGVPGKWKLFAPAGENDPIENLPQTIPKPVQDRLLDHLTPRLTRRPRTARVLMGLIRRL